MRHRLILAIAAAALVAVPGAVASGPQLGTTTTLNAPNYVSYVASPNGGTTGIEVRAADGHVLRKASLTGAWGIPLVTIQGDAGGLSRNGRLLVLSESKNLGRPLRDNTQFLVLDTRKLAITRTIKLKGDFAFDALSPNGRTLYLIEHHVSSDLSRYRVRAYNLATGSLWPGVIVDKREIDEPMSGFPIARVASGDGRRVFTLYTSEEHPFVHLLDTVSRAAFCIDLPKSSNAQALDQASMKLSNGGRSLTILGSGALGLKHVVNTKTLNVS